MALALLVAPIGAIAHAMEPDAFAADGVAVTAATDIEHCCQTFVHTAKSSCHFDAGLLRTSTGHAGREASAVVFDDDPIALADIDPSGLLDPPRPV